MPGTRDDDVPTTRSNLPLPWPSNSGPRFAGLGVAADDHVQLTGRAKTLPSPDRWPVQAPPRRWAVVSAAAAVQIRYRDIWWRNNWPTSDGHMLHRLSRY